MQKKLIFFDLYQTLLDVDTSDEKGGQKAGFDKVITPYLVQNGIPKAKAMLALARYSDEVHEFYKNHPVELFHHDFAKILSDVFLEDYNLNLSAEKLNDLIYAFRKISRGYLHLYPNVPQVLQTLSSDYTLAVASYTQGTYSERELEELDIKKFFTYRIYSSDIGFRKKSDQFFKKSLEIVGMNAEDCLMVGDNLYEDMFMANQNGLHTIWIINPLTKDRVKAAVNPEAKLPIESVRELPKLVSKIFNQSGL